jgi:hypothetical protein
MRSAPMDKNLLANLLTFVLDVNKSIKNQDAPRMAFSLDSALIFGFFRTLSD